MKKRIISLVLLAVAALVAVSCGKSKEDEPKKEEAVSVSISVSDIANNAATVAADVKTGKATSGKIVACVPVEQVDVDYEKVILLINYIESNGEAIQFPFTTSLSKLKAGVDYFSAVLVYDADGRAADAAYEIWTAEGLADGWSQENSAGELTPNQW